MSCECVGDRVVKVLDFVLAELLYPLKPFTVSLVRKL